MFCKNCGKDLAGSEFCANCGAKAEAAPQTPPPAPAAPPQQPPPQQPMQAAPPPPQQPPQYQQPPQHQGQQSGFSGAFNQATSSFTGGNPQISKLWIWALINVGALLIIFLPLAFATQTRVHIPGIWGLGRTITRFGFWSWFFLFTGLFDVAQGFVWAYILSNRFKKTAASINGDRLVGTAVNADLSVPLLIFVGMGWNKTNLMNFNIGLNEITGIFVEQGAIIIHTAQGKYKCFVPDAAGLKNEIDQKIMANRA
ncbi:MAG: hypothetical protein FWE04_02185 [Oscillospiraceae bacterium]|nr:hypothetical protein [Oscillospiraceae bacterium]